jgi:hypothetical protein
MAQDSAMSRRLQLHAAATALTFRDRPQLSVTDRARHRAHPVGSICAGPSSYGVITGALQNRLICGVAGRAFLGSHDLAGRAERGRQVGTHIGGDVRPDHPSTMKTLSDAVLSCHHRRGSTAAPEREPLTLEDTGRRGISVLAAKAGAGAAQDQDSSGSRPFNFCGGAHCRAVGRAQARYARQDADAAARVWRGRRCPGPAVPSGSAAHRRR